MVHKKNMSLLKNLPALVRIIDNISDRRIINTSDKINLNDLESDDVDTIIEKFESERENFFDDMFPKHEIFEIYRVIITAIVYNKIDAPEITNFVIDLLQKYVDPNMKHQRDLIRDGINRKIIDIEIIDIEKVKSGLILNNSKIGAYHPMLLCFVIMNYFVKEMIKNKSPKSLFRIYINCGNWPYIKSYGEMITLREYIKVELNYGINRNIKEIFNNQTNEKELQI